MQVVIQDSVSIPASSTVENVIAQNTGAQRYIRPPFHAKGMLLATVSVDLLRAELVVNGRTILDDSAIRQSGVANNIDVLRDVVVPEFHCPMGGQLVLRAINPSAGAKILNYRIVMEETAEQKPANLITQRGPISIAAGGRVSLLTGLKFERARIDSILSVWATASAAGLLLSVFTDGVNVAPPSPIAAQNAIPDNPRDLIFDEVEIPQGTLIELIAENPTGGALNINWRTSMQELGFVQ